MYKLLVLLAAFCCLPFPAQTAPSSDLTTNATARVAELVRPRLDDKHQLRAGDKISFRIIEDREEAKALVVTDSGELEVPYLGRLPAAGKTCRQLADELKIPLEKDYYYHATLVISLDTVNKVSGRIYVWGQVKEQGPLDIPVDESFTVRKAILRAGGFSEFADKKKVKVIRKGATENAEKQTFLLDMVDILEKGKTENDIVLQPDDFIIVPQKLINF